MADLSFVTLAQESPFLCDFCLSTFLSTFRFLRSEIRIKSMFSSGADASKSEPVRMGVCVGNPSFGGITNSGLDGSRTRVRKPIPCPSTSVVYHLTFPLSPEDKHPDDFSSFMIRPHAQSFASVVSHRVEAGILKCECSRADCCN